MSAAGPLSAAPRGPQPRLGDILLRARVITDAQLQSALADQKKWGGRLGRILVDLGYLDERTMSLALSRQLGIPCIDLAATQLPVTVAELMSVQVCEQLGVMPVGTDPQRRVLRLATSDPTNFGVLEEAAKRTDLTIEPVIAGANDIDAAIRRYYYGDQRAMSRVALPGFTPTEQRVAPPVPQVAPLPQPASTDLSQLAARLDRLEELASRQTRALRVLVEMLVESGLVDLDAFQRRARGD